MTTANKVKLAVTIIAIVLVLVLIFQNRHSVETAIFFWSPEMPRAVLLLITLLIGFGAGAITTWFYHTRHR